MVERLLHHEIHACRDGIMEAVMAEVSAEREEIEKQMKKGWRACRESLLESIMADHEQLVARTESGWHTCREELFASVGKEMATERSKVLAQVEKELKTAKDGIMRSVMTEVEREWTICREGLTQGLLQEMSAEQKESTADEKQLLEHVEEALKVALQAEATARKELQNSLRGRIEAVTLIRENGEREILARLKDFQSLLQDSFTRVTEHCDTRLKEERNLLHGKLRQQQERLERHVASVCEDVVRLVEGHSAGSNPRRGGSSSSRHHPAEPAGACERPGRASATVSVSPVASDLRGVTGSGTSPSAVPRRSVVEDFHNALAAGSAASAEQPTD